MLLYACTIFLSAFLLFQVQPLLGRYILPWFGGTPAVWTTCLLFFQSVLVAGYLYSHGVVSRLSPRRQGLVHLVLLLGSLLLLPIIPSSHWKPTTPGDPTWRILLLLARTVGLPYLVVSTTGPLLQGWFARSHPGKSPYRLYSLSNIGSLLALVTYPVIVERALLIRQQAWLWSLLYVVFVLLAAILARQVMALPDEGPAAAAAQDESGPPAALTVLLWLALAAGGSWLLMATTNQLCQDVAVVPFLWVVPLSLYLISFIICFDQEHWYQRVVFLPALALAFGLGVWLVCKGIEVNILKQILGYSFVQFAFNMVCHGELVRLKPGPRYLTLFYLMVSVGGALSGVFIALGAPRVFTGFFEYPIGLAAVFLAVVLVLAREVYGKLNRGVLFGLPAWFALAGLGTAAFYGSLGANKLHKELYRSERTGILAQLRDFYGVLRVSDYDPGLPEHRYTLRHGRILHGYQYQMPEKKAWRTSYYGAKSGAGLSLEHCPLQPKKVGVIGLGSGALSAYAERGDHFVFYDINPDVLTLTTRWFSYVQDARERGAQVDIKLGDARITMEQEVAARQPQAFDVLVVDAFSGDAIPVHLLTKECVDLYWKQLKPDGILVVHISNRYINLKGICRALATACGRKALLIRNDKDDDRGVLQSDYVLLTNNTWFLSDPTITAATSDWEERDRPVLWTDDYSNLYGVLKIRR